MEATRFLRTSGTSGLRRPPSSSSSSYHFSLNSNSTLSSTRTKIRNSLSNDAEKSHGGAHEKKPSSVAAKAVAVATFERLIMSPSEPPMIDLIVDLASVVTKLIGMALMIFQVAAKTRPRKFHVQMFIERCIIDCRFFALFAVAGSLLGSVLCFVEGCFMVIESYLQYFHALSQRSDQGHVVHLLVEAIDMFLIGTAMLVFGMGLHGMFVAAKGKGSQLPAGSNLFGLFNLKTLPRWACMQSVTQAKSKMGHAVIMIMQVGVLDKFKSVPLATGLDLACFAGAIFVSSACLFLLSRLSFGGNTVSDR
ncbi:uncharacterized protein LOC130758483 [Actinidia eriantha]|uniref:uncharacterized protein LOC130758483 n=1 Tax=Actinidia eriantha TaxID=165200 RepID=UPI0025865CF4|nr:uncharacterized protein LOC130758483 [Actinidia eriantha]